MEFERALEDLRAKHKIPGLSAAIVGAQKVVWSKGYGMQDRERKIAAAPDTPYLVASLTKTFASVLLMQLVEQRKLTLDDPLVNYLPKTSSVMAALRRPDIHVRHVFTHTSEGKPGEEYRYSGARYGALTFVVEKSSGTSFATIDGKILRATRRCADPWLIGGARVDLIVFFRPGAELSLIWASRPCDAGLQQFPSGP
ncbi:MAG: serine hydrolase domain-containing protein [Bryobacteraceae bacterium]